MCVYWMSSWLATKTRWTISITFFCMEIIYVSSSFKIIKHLDRFLQQSRQSISVTDSHLWIARKYHILSKFFSFILGGQIYNILEWFRFVKCTKFHHWIAPSAGRNPSNRISITASSIPALAQTTLCLFRIIKSSTQTKELQTAMYHILRFKDFGIYPNS